MLNTHKTSFEDAITILDNHLQTDELEEVLLGLHNNYYGVEEALTALIEKRKSML